PAERNRVVDLEFKVAAGLFTRQAQEALPDQIRLVLGNLGSVDTAGGDLQPAARSPQRAAQGQIKRDGQSVEPRPEAGARSRHPCANFFSRTHPFLSQTRKLHPTLVLAMGEKGSHSFRAVRLDLMRDGDNEMPDGIPDGSAKENVGWEMCLIRNAGKGSER